EEGKTYAEALTEAGIPLGAEDISSVDMNSEVARDTEVTLQRVTYELRPVDTPIPFTTEYEPTRHLPEGKEKILNKGEEGVLTTYFKDKKIDGVTVESVYDHEAVTKTPVSAKAQIGDADAPIDYIQPPADFQLDENGIPVSYSRVITGKGTAYSANPGAWGASGRHLHTGYVAVDPKIIPYGSRLYIRSADGSYVYGYAIAADTGIALLDGRVLVDVYFNNYSDACKFGAKKVEVYVLN
ncbi:MAG: G5 domain-containing protein, partial [Oscillospiraceae bacterium]|nr:G5 domain-containing protein [Oscillospiraceae bacterium]